MLSYRFPGAYAAWLLTVVPLGLGGRTRWKSRSETRNALSPKACPTKQVSPSRSHQAGLTKQVSPSRSHQAGLTKQVPPSRSYQVSHEACPPKCPPKRSFYKLFFVLLWSPNAGHRCVWFIHTVSVHAATDNEHSDFFSASVVAVLKCRYTPRLTANTQFRANVAQHRPPRSFGGGL